MRSRITFTVLAVAFVARSVLVVRVEFVVSVLKVAVVVMSVLIVP